MAVEVHPQSKHCRNCGQEVETVGDTKWCLNEQCKPKGHQTREYCEHDGHPQPGPGRCPRCRELPLGTR